MRNNWRLFVALLSWCLVDDITHAQSNQDSRMDARVVQFLEDQYPELFYPDFDLVKRYNSYAFGLGKRKPFSFGLGKRAKQFNFGLGKRAEMYGFGLGKRSVDATTQEDIVEQSKDTQNTRVKRNAVDWDNYYDPAVQYQTLEKRPRSFNFGLGKRARSYAFGLGKRWPMDYPTEDTELNDYDSNRLQQLIALTERANMETKRAKNPYSFGLGKRSYSFGLGKRAGYSFGLGKREQPYEEEQLQNEYAEKRPSYRFGLGKRAYNFGLGKRSISESQTSEPLYPSQ